MNVLKPNFDKRGGLLPTVVQDARTFEVLMIAYVDEAAWLKTLATAEATFRRTSGERDLWTKGKTSGNILRVVGVGLDCDGDAIVYYVIPEGDGVACHTGARSCVYRSCLGDELMPSPNAGAKERLDEADVPVHESLAGHDIRPFTRSYVGALERRLIERLKASSEKSYTRKLLDKGVNACSKKLGEEIVELAIAAASETVGHVVAESADVVYHLLVFLLAQGIPFRLVEDELRQREGKSGLQEKASRPS